MRRFLIPPPPVFALQDQGRQKAGRPPRWANESSEVNKRPADWKAATVVDRPACRTRPRSLGRVRILRRGEHLRFRRVLQVHRSDETGARRPVPFQFDRRLGITSRRHNRRPPTGEKSSRRRPQHAHSRTASGRSSRRSGKMRQQAGVLGSRRFLPPSRFGVRDWA